MASRAHKITETMTFLRLPKNIRQQILREAGFRRVCPIQISRERTRLSHQRTGDFVNCWRLWQCSAEPEALRGTYWRRGHLSPICWHAALPVQLLRVCRRFYEDGSPILYGENTFIVECSGYPAASCMKLHVRPISAVQNYTLLSEIHQSRIDSYNGNVRTEILA